MSGALTLTPLLEFEAAASFRFRQPNAGPESEQAGEARERYLTSSEPFANQVLLGNPQVFRVLKARASLPCLPREKWAGTDYRGRKVLFLLPGEALGENAAIALFLSAFIAAMRPEAVGVFCARSCADIFLRDPRIRVFPLWIARREVRRWNLLVDLGQLESRRSIDTWPVDMEGELLAAFGGIAADEARYPSAARAMAPKSARPAIGLFPIASSPLRTLPPAVGLALAEGLAEDGDVTLVLNAGQRQGQLYRAAMRDRLPQAVRIVEQFESIGALMQAIAAFDFAVFADSGPSHLAKLVAVPGVTVYSSAPADVLQGRFRNLAAWTIPFAGPHCRSPCGLARLRKDAAGRVGCMGSLGLPLDALPQLAGRADAAEVDRLQREPVPCLATLAAEPGALVSFVRAALRRRLAPHVAG